MSFRAVVKHVISAPAGKYACLTYFSYSLCSVRRFESGLTLISVEQLVKHIKLFIHITSTFKYTLIIIFCFTYSVSIKYVSLSLLSRYNLYYAPSFIYLPSLVKMFHQYKQYMHLKCSFTIIFITYI